MILLKIGSNPQCDIVLKSNKVSSLHAEITVLNNGDILLEDKNSLNGTFIMNQKIQPATTVSIKRGDAIRFGDTELQWAQVPYPENNSAYKKVLGIGSNFRNEIQVTGNTVSRFHATLKVDKKGRAFIEDHSLNGTTVNGNRIASHQNIRVKPNDAVVVGGVPINIKNYVGGNMAGTVLKVLCGIAALALLVFGIKWLIGGHNGDTNPPLKALAQATPFVYGAYYVEVTIKDDPFVGLLSGWPEKWQFGIDSDGDLRLGTLTGADVSPIQFSGTAFFISEFGEMGTNRHIAVPWEYLTPVEMNEIRQQMQKQVGTNIGTMSDLIAQILRSAIYSDVLTMEDAVAYLERFAKSEFIISGRFDYLGIILPGRSFTTLSDLESCQVIAESGDANRDVALIRLNTRQTPDYIVKNGYYKIENARVDESTLSITDDQLRIIGYPGGMSVGFKTGNGEEINPSVHSATLSKKPDRNGFQVQTVGLGGQSGSPVIDAKRNLVGVFYGGLKNNEISYCCNIRHLVDLFNENKVKD
jgi:pSer/pThr/pTyr-binding forkhead associated (FHA) protein